LGALALAAIFVPLATDSFGQEGGRPGFSSNFWEPGRSQAWDLERMSPGERQRMLRHWTFMNKEVPETYLMQTNDIGYTTAAIAAGGPLYLANCARCHGESGLGNGELAQDLTPSPALLAFLVQQPIAIDQYLLWSISEGGKKFGTAMPAFKDQLTQEQIWQIVAYLRAGLPEVAAEGTPPKPAVPPAAETDKPGQNKKATE
jgi:mono/diheme cytochrome c family protein